MTLADFTSATDVTGPNGQISRAGGVWSVPPTAVASATRVRIDVDTVFDENSKPADNHYLKWAAAQSAGTSTLQVKGQTALKFAMAAVTVGSTGNLKPVGQTIHVRFSQPVRNLSFVITDIDGNGSNQWDRVFITHVNGASVDPAAPAFSADLGANVQGIGTTTAPWQSAYSASVGDENANGNIRVSMPGDVSSFTFRFRNLADAANSNSLNLADLKFQSLATTACRPA